MFNIFNKKDNHVEGAEEKEELLKLSLKDDDLVRQIDLDVQRAMPLYTEIKKVQDENEDYYLGQQLDVKKFDYELPTAENLLYMATETIISIITSSRKEPIVLPAQESQESKELKEKTQQFLTWKWGDEKMKIKFEDWVRHAMLYRIGVFKVRWDLETDDFVIENVRPQKIMIDRNAKNEREAKYIVEFKEDSLDTLITRHPEAKDKLIKEFGNKLGTMVKYLEYWTNEFVVWKVNKIIISKKKNPYWNWDEKDRKENLKKLKARWIDKTNNEKLDNILLNYFDAPTKPYVILSLKNLGRSIYAETSDFEQGKVCQDIVNKRKRSIDKAAIHALGREVVSGDFMDKKEAQKIIGNPNAPIWLQRGKAQDALAHTAPKPVSPVLFDDLMDSKQALDNIMGTHGTTRGEQGPKETARGRTILREGDMGRIDLSVRRIDTKLELLYGWMLQMAKVFYNESHYIKMMGIEGATSYLQYSQDDVEDGQEIIVKSEITVEKATQRENAVQKMQMGITDPLTMFESLDEPNAKEHARRLVLYNMDPKMYLQQFCVDAETEGMETDPVFSAQNENKQLMQGEQVPPFQGTNKEHLDEHSKFAKTGDFQKAEPEIKANFMKHIEEELEILKRSKV